MKTNRPVRLAVGAVLGALAIVLSCSPTEEFQVIRVERDEGKQVVDPVGRADLAVLFTGSTRGEFEPCGCGGVYEGGFARRSVVIDRLRRVNPELLLVDTGDIVSSTSQAQLEFIAQAHGVLRYDAIGLGEGDLRAGVDSLDRYARQYKLPLVCSNLKFKTSAKTPMCVREYISLERAGRKIAVISVVADRWLAILPRSVRDQVVYETPAKALHHLVPQLRGDYSAIVLLSHLGPSVRETMTDTDLEGVDLWIDTGGHQWAQRTQRTGLTPPATQRAAASVIKTPDQTCLFLDRIPPMMLSWYNDRMIGVAGIKWQSDKLTVPIARMISLEKGMVEDKKFLEIYDAYKYVSRQEMVRLLTTPTTTSSRPDAFQYVPSKKCAACHKEIYDFWKTTKHARAFETLTRNGRDADLNCWACHTVGYREDTGFKNPLATPTLVGVGCQDCHLKDLRKHPTSDRPATTQAAKTNRFRGNLTQTWHCQRCHVPHRSPSFEIKSYTKKIACPQALGKPVEPKP